MHRIFAAVHGTGAAAAAGIWLAVAALGPQAAEGQLWAAVAVSPSTLDCSQAHGIYPSQASAALAAVQYCAKVGANDCRAVAVVMNACVALATTPHPGTQYGYGTSPTRDGAAAVALAACARAGGANCAVEESPCAGDDPRGNPPLPLPPPAVPPLPVDPGLVSIWQATVPGGIWLWQIAANGTYTFRSESTDQAPSHDGMFTAGSGKYKLHSITMNWDDQGTYTIQPGGNAVVFSGKLGTGTWTRVASSPTSPPPTGPVPGVGIRK